VSLLKEQDKGPCASGVNHGSLAERMLVHLRRDTRRWAMVTAATACEFSSTILAIRRRLYHNIVFVDIA